MQWYYSKDLTQLGPVSESELRAKVLAGEVLGSDKVWREGMTDWQPVSLVPAFQSLIPGHAATGGAGMPHESPYRPPLAGPAAVIPVGKPTSGLAIASLVCGIVGLVSCFLPGIAAVVCGHMALSRIAASGSQLQGRGMAVAGLVMGYLCVACILLFFGILMLGTLGTSSAFGSL